MNTFRRRSLPIAALGLLAFTIHAGAQEQSPTNTTTSLGVTITVPGVYESTIASLGALATSSAAAAKTNRSNARTMAIRTALSTALRGAGTSVTTLTLDKTDTNPVLGEVAILCTPRENFVPNQVYLNYLNTLVKNIDTVGTKAVAPTDILSALKLLLASSSFAVTDNVKIDAATLASAEKTTLAACQADLSAYDTAYYGIPIRPPGLSSKEGSPSPATGVDTFAFLGPIGTLIDSFLSILQPVLIDASQIVDENRRMQAIEAALNDPGTQTKIQTTGQQLAIAVDSLAAQSRESLVGAFTEQLVAIRETPIDLKNVADCAQLNPAVRLPSGAPNAAFIDCWSAAWAKLQPQVANLTTIADNYDTLADANTQSAQKLFNTIMANFALIKEGKISYSSIMLNEITQFITLANAVASAASSSNLASLKSAAQAASK
jgi:hypothetical protein